jgi:hypothetical protein
VGSYFPFEDLKVQVMVKRFVGSQTIKSLKIKVKWHSIGTWNMTLKMFLQGLHILAFNFFNQSLHSWIIFAK